MLAHILQITQSIVDSFLHVWPYLLVTIPLAVAVNMSGAARYINRALTTRPITAIFLATLVGAFSPFCSCGVIPIVAALLMGGVPLAPVMTFWIASPSMDPEIFFLSVATLGWKLAVWRLGATLVLSITAGFLTHFLVQRGWVGQQILRTQSTVSVKTRWEWVSQNVKNGWQWLRQRVSPPFWQQNIAFAGAAQSTCCGTTEAVYTSDVQVPSDASCNSGCQTLSQGSQSSCGSGGKAASKNFSNQLLGETWKATAMVVKFMLLAFFLKALIMHYVPSEWILRFLGPENPHAIFAAALIGIPMYTSNLTALPMMSGLLAQGMNPAAVLAFLIAGPITTLPAMAAVWGITTRRVFALYVSFSLLGALLTGYIFTLVATF